MVNKKVSAKISYGLIVLQLMLLSLFSAPVLAVDVAPRISDREIIESLAELKSGQVSLHAEMKANQQVLNKRIDDLRAEMKSGQVSLRAEMKANQQVLNKRIDDLRAEMKSGQVSLRAEMKANQQVLNKRIDDLRVEMKSGQAALGARMTDMTNTMLALFLGLMTLIVALFAYIAWDRRTMMRPVLVRLDHLEQEFKRDLDIGNEAGSKLSRLIKAMRELSLKDKNVAAVLRSFSLL